jgi:hypothetical protein
MTRQSTSPCATTIYRSKFETSQPLVHALPKEKQGDMFTQSFSADLFLDLQNAIELRNQPLIK